MAKRKFTLSTPEANELLAAYQASSDGPTRTRYQALRLYGLGYPLAEVLAITNCSRTSLFEWCRHYRSAGVQRLRDQRLGGNHTKLTRAQRQELQERLHQYRPAELLGSAAFSPSGAFWTVEDLQQMVQRWYGVTYRSRSSYTDLLGQCGFSYQRTERRFSSRREARVTEFEEQLEKN